MSLRSDHTVSKREISSIETLNGVHDFSGQLQGSTRGHRKKVMVELVFRDDDNFTHCVPAVSRLVGCDDVDFVETPDCRWIPKADTIGVLLVAAELAIKNSIARKSYYVRGRFKHNPLRRIQV
jgi:hypothetical protein